MVSVDGRYFESWISTEVGARARTSAPAASSVAAITASSAAIRPAPRRPRRRRAGFRAAERPTPLRANLSSAFTPVTTFDPANRSTRHRGHARSPGTGERRTVRVATVTSAVGTGGPDASGGSEAPDTSYSRAGEVVGGAARVPRVVR